MSDDSTVVSTIDYDAVVSDDGSSTITMMMDDNEVSDDSTVCDSGVKVVEYEEVVSDDHGRSPSDQLSAVPGKKCLLNLDGYMIRFF